MMKWMTAMIAAAVLGAMIAAACGDDEVTSKGTGDGQAENGDDSVAPECEGDRDCLPETGYCESDTGKCVECLTDTHCDQDEVCNADRECGPREPEDDNQPDAGSSETTDGGTEEEPPTGSCQSDGDCDDENSCTLDFCNDDACAYIPRSGEGCEEPTECETDADCEGTTDCLAMLCVGGRCASQPAEEGTACESDNACTADTCDGWGNCLTGEEIACDDGNDCTDDSCDDEAGCIFADNSAECSDSNACTSGDVCNGGVCGGTAFSGQIGGGTLCCVSDADCDSDTCEENHTCSTVSSGGVDDNPPLNNDVVISFNSATSMITVTGDVRTVTIDCQGGATPGSLMEYYLVRWGGGPIPSVHHPITVQGSYTFQVGSGSYSFTPRASAANGGTCWASLNSYDVQPPVQRVLDENGSSYHLELTVP